MYDFKETLGKGHFSVVKLAQHVISKQRVAVKIIDKLKLKPDELLKIAAGLEVTGCRAVAGNGGAGAGAAVAGPARPPRSQVPRAPGAALWSNVVSSRGR